MGIHFWIDVIKQEVVAHLTPPVYRTAEQKKICEPRSAYADNMEATQKSNREWREAKIEINKPNNDDDFTEV